MAFNLGAKYKNLSLVGNSQEQMTFAYQVGMEKRKFDKGLGIEIKSLVERPLKKGETPIIHKLKIEWSQDDSGQHLSFYQDKELAATFTLLPTAKTQLKVKPIWDEAIDLIVIPENKNFKPFQAVSLDLFVKKWLLSPQFSEHLVILSEGGTYTPSLVKMLFLYLSHRNAIEEVMANSNEERYRDDIEVDMEVVAKDFLDTMQSFVPEGNAKMQRLYGNSIALLNSATNEEVEAE